MADRISVGWVVRQILARALLPHHAVRWIRRRRRHERVAKARADHELKLYGRMLPGDFLHYGYFDDPTTPPERISFDALQRAQHRYAEEVCELVGPPGAAILDAGSGMGGMLGVLRDMGHDVTGLTPDRHQVAYVREAYPDVPVLACRFEDMPSHDHRGRFGVVVHAESLQYMDPRGVFPIVREILAPRGDWIVADYFRTRADEGDADRSGWPLAEFRRRAAKAGFRIVQERDITANVLPTLAFAHFLAIRRIGLPVFDFAQDKLRAKAPALYYVVENVARAARNAAVRSSAAIDPGAFAARKRYLLMTLQCS